MSDKQIIDNAIGFCWSIAIACILLIILFSIIKQIEQDKTFKEIIKSMFDFRYLTKKIINLIYGQKYIVRVNGVWSVCRGRWCHKHDLLKIKYGKDKHVWMLDGRNWISISKNWSDEMIENRVAVSNIDELKKAHPQKKKKPSKLTAGQIYSNFIRDNNL